MQSTLKITVILSAAAVTLALTGCSGSDDGAAKAPTPLPTPTVTAVLAPSPQVTESASPTATQSVSETASPEPSPTEVVPGPPGSVSATDLAASLSTAYQPQIPSPLTVDCSAGLEATVGATSTCVLTVESAGDYTVTVTATNVVNEVVSYTSTATPRS